MYFWPHVGKSQKAEGFSVCQQFKISYFDLDHPVLISRVNQWNNILTMIFPHSVLEMLSKSRY